MSMDAHGHATPAAGEPIPRPEDEKLPVTKIAAVAIVSLVIFALAVLWTAQILRGTVDDTEIEFGPRNPPTELAKPEIGIVDMQMFQREERAQLLTESKLQRIQSAGWVSRREQIVHIPIQDAMRAITEGRRPAEVKPQPSLQPGMMVPGTFAPETSATPTDGSGAQDDGGTSAQEPLQGGAGTQPPGTQP